MTSRARKLVQIGAGGHLIPRNAIRQTPAACHARPAGLRLLAPMVAMGPRRAAGGPSCRFHDIGI